MPGFPGPVTQLGLLMEPYWALGRYVPDSGTGTPVLTRSGLASSPKFGLQVW